MVRYGFIHTKEDIKFLVLFAMDLLPFPVSFSTIVDLTTWCDEGFGYFELSEAFYEMVPTGHIEEIPDEGETLYAITEKGRYPHFREAASLSGPRSRTALCAACRPPDPARRRHPHRRHRARPERPDRPHGNGAGVRGGNERRQSRTGCHARAYL